MLCAWPELDQAGAAQHEPLIPTSFDKFRMRVGIHEPLGCGWRPEAASRDKVRRPPWVPTFVGTSGERAVPCWERAMRADWTPAFAGDAAEGPLPEVRPVGAA